MKDLIGSSHMIPGNFTSFIEDRFGCLNSSLALNGGWTQVPSDIYFDSPEFTISVWVYPTQTIPDARIIDFGNGPSSDNIIISLSDGTSLKPYIALYSGSNRNLFASSTTSLFLNQWQLLAYSFNGSTSSIYLNGTLTGQSFQSYSMPALNRTNCYIGKSNWASNGYSDSYLDDLRFYNKSLTQEEIINEIMNVNQSQISNYFKINSLMIYSV